MLKNHFKYYYMRIQKRTTSKI